MLWGCNIALILFAVGSMTGRPLLVGAASNVVAVDQLCWYLDLLGYAVLRKFPIGVAKYLIWWDVPYSKKVTALHHIWFLPVCMIYARCNGGLAHGSWLLSVLLTSGLAIICRAFTPYEAQLPGVQAKPATVVHLNINLCYCFWKDIDVKFLHWLDNKPAWMYLPYLMFICNVILNGLPCLLLQWIASV